MAAPSGIIGNGGATGALAEFLLIENAVRGTSLEVVPDHIPFEVAALNEPMAVARHGVNRCQPKPSDKVLVFGAGPIGLGATIALKSVGVDHVVVADLIPARLDKALKVGADAVINSADRTSRSDSWSCTARAKRCFLAEQAPTSILTLQARQR
jgi:threonine dehydrogenase-like Zn-dependent dehydrogenase